jgi:hypothetical protein
MHRRTGRYSGIINIPSSQEVDLIHYFSKLNTLNVLQVVSAATQFAAKNQVNKS